MVNRFLPGLRGVFLYDIDDLNGVVESNLEERMREAHRAERIIDDELTGFAGWLIACMCRSILGVRPEFDGLRIDPCVPGWEKFQMRRVFRGVTYDIRVRNPGRVEYGVKHITVNGKPVAGNVAPVPPGRPGRKTARVDVLMG